MKKPSRFLIGAGFIILLGVGVVFFATRHSPLATPEASAARQEAGAYYCPMHPTYTSDRPGDCPICNMKLVKRETAARPAPSGRPAAKPVKDICYMHNCPMVHQGQPCPMLVMAKEGEEVTCPVCGKHVAEKLPKPSSKKILYWTDPMIPGYKSDKPGKSPMGMDMVPVYEEEGGAATEVGAPVGYAPVLLTPQKQQFIGVKTAPAARRHLVKTIRTVGTIAHDPELYQAQAERLQALKTWREAQQRSPEVAEQARRLVESTTVRLRHLGLSEELIEEMAGWETPERGLLYSEPGEPVWVYAKVYEYELPLVRVGQELTVEVPAMPGERFDGTILSVDPRVDSMTRTARVRAQLADPRGALKPEMYVNVEIAVDLGEVLAVPEEAVFNTGTKQIVFVDKGQGLFEPRDVTVGAKADGSYEVKGGVSNGEPVVTSGNFLIDSESRLKAALEGLTDSATSPHEH